MPSQELCLEALSAVSGCTVSPAAAGGLSMSPQDFINVVALKEFYAQEGLLQLEYPSLGTLSLRDMNTTTTLALPDAPSAAAAELPTNRPRVYIDPAEFFAPQWDYDFTGLADGAAVFTRGKERYVRPCGWNRVALKVLEKYGDGDGWLGTGDAAWPVSYHGNAMDGSQGVIFIRGKKGEGAAVEDDDDDDDDDDEGPGPLSGATRGRGVYSTPDVDVAESFSKTFRSRVDGKVYKVVLQNRINPQQRQLCRREKFWLVYVPEDSSALQERAIVESSIRPYGLLLKQV